MAIVNKCDRCGSIIESIKSYRKYIVKKKLENDVYDDDEIRLDLCDECYDKLVKFLENDKDNASDDKVETDVEYRQDESKDDYLKESLELYKRNLISAKDYNRLNDLIEFAFSDYDEESNDMQNLLIGYGISMIKKYMDNRLYGPVYDYNIITHPIRY